MPDRRCLIEYVKERICGGVCEMRNGRCNGRCVIEYPDRRCVIGYVREKIYGGVCEREDERRSENRIYRTQIANARDEHI